MEILLLHGVNNTETTWLQMQEHLHESGRHSLALRCPALKTVESIADRIAIQLDRSYFIVGHSFGGMVALAFAQKYPELTLGLALVNSSLGADTDTARAARLVRIERGLRGEYESMANEASSRAYHPSNQGRSDLVLAREKEISQYGSEAYIAHQFAMASRPDRSLFFKNFKGPKIVIAADMDLVVPTDNQLSAAALAGAETAVIENAGHMLPAEQPRELARVVSDWVERHARLT